MNGIKVDVINKKVIMNKRFAQRMANTSSEEYREYERIMSINPAFAVEVRIQKTYEGNRYRGLTYRFIEAYIYCHEFDDESRRVVFSEYVEERWKALAHTCGFQEVRAWFLYKYPEFDNLYFTTHEEPPRDKIEELMMYSAHLSNGKLIPKNEPLLLSA